MRLSIVTQVACPRQCAQVVLICNALAGVE
jgi:hypothetical protein